MTAPGWYPDTTRPGQLRWWDGTAWTENYAPDPQAAAPAPQPTPQAAAPAPAPPSMASAPPPPAAAGSGTNPIPSQVGGLSTGLLGAGAAVLGALIAFISCFLPIMSWLGFSVSEWDAHKWLVLVVVLCGGMSVVLGLVAAGIFPVDVMIRRVIGGVLVLFCLLILVQWFSDWMDIENNTGTSVWGYSTGVSRGIGLFTLPLGTLLMAAGGVVSIIAPDTKKD